MHEGKHKPGSWHNSFRFRLTWIPIVLVSTGCGAGREELGPARRFWWWLCWPGLQLCIWSSVSVTEILPCPQSWEPPCSVNAGPCFLFSADEVDKAVAISNWPVFIFKVADVFKRRPVKPLTFGTFVSSSLPAGPASHYSALFRQTPELLLGCIQGTQVSQDGSTKKQWTGVELPNFVTIAVGNVFTWKLSASTKT